MNTPTKTLLFSLLTVTLAVATSALMATPPNSDTEEATASGTTPLATSATHPSAPPLSNTVSRATKTSNITPIERAHVRNRLSFLKPRGQLITLCEGALVVAYPREAHFKQLLDLGHVINRGDPQKLLFQLDINDADSLAETLEHLSDQIPARFPNITALDFHMFDGPGGHDTGKLATGGMLPGNGAFAKHLPNLTWVMIYGGLLNAETAHHFSQCPSLKNLFIRRNTVIEGEALKHLAHVEKLQLANEPTADHLQGLPHMPNLRTLEWFTCDSKANITAALLPHTLTSLKIYFNDANAQQGIEHLQNLKNLTVVWKGSLELLSNLTSVKDLELHLHEKDISLAPLQSLEVHKLKIAYDNHTEVLDLIPHYPHIKELEIFKKMPEDAPLAPALRNATQLELLRITKKPNAEDAACFAQLPALKTLKIANNYITDDLLAPFHGNTQLTYLDITANALTDASKDTLLSMTGLQYLNISANEMSDEVIEEIKKAFQGTTFYGTRPR